jgi:hypothetical protein
MSFFDRANASKNSPEPLDIGEGMALNLLQAVYRNSNIDLPIRMRAAALAIGYEAPKLAVIAEISERDFATLLDKRLENLKRIEQNQANGQLIEASPVEIAPTPSINYRSLRRRI